MNRGRPTDALDCRGILLDQDGVPPGHRLDSSTRTAVFLEIGGT